MTHQFTIAKVKNEALKTLPETYQTFVIKRDGEVFGELKYDRGRWKSAGGPAWKGTCNHYVFYAKDKKKVLEWFKSSDTQRIFERHYLT